MSDKNFKKFIETWEEEIKKIETEVLDKQGSWRIYYRFRDGRLGLVNNMRISFYTIEVSTDLNLLESKLTRALEVAQTKYKLKSNSLFVRFFESVADIIKGVPKPKL